jgi:hypothetical protein
MEIPRETTEVASSPLPPDRKLRLAKAEFSAWTGQGMRELRSPVRFSTPHPLPYDSLLLLAQENSHLKITKRH